jgi:hypothetical protein
VPVALILVEIIFSRAEAAAGENKEIIHGK